MQSAIDSFYAVRLSGEGDKAIDLMKAGEKEAESLDPAAIQSAIVEIRASLGAKGIDYESLEENMRTTALHAHFGRIRAGRYFRERDIALLEFNGEPVKFEIQRPTPRWLAAEIGPIKSEDERQMHAFACLVHTIVQGDKVVLEARKPERKGAHTLTQTSSGAWMAPDSYLYAVQRKFGNEAIKEMGQLALLFAELTDEQTAPFGSWGGSVARPINRG